MTPLSTPVRFLPSSTNFYPTPGARRPGSCCQSLVDIQHWIENLPLRQQQTSAARLLVRMIDHPHQELAWNSREMLLSLEGELPMTLKALNVLRDKCNDLLAAYRFQGQWTVQVVAEDPASLRLTPGGMMLDYLRELRPRQTGQRRF